MRLDVLTGHARFSQPAVEPERRRSPSASGAGRRGHGDQHHHASRRRGHRRATTTTTSHEPSRPHDAVGLDRRGNDTADENMAPAWSRCIWRRSKARVRAPSTLARRRCHGADRGEFRARRCRAGIGADRPPRPGRSCRRAPLSHDPRMARRHAGRPTHHQYHASRHSRFGARIGRVRPRPRTPTTLSFQLPHRLRARLTPNTVAAASRPASIRDNVAERLRHRHPRQDHRRSPPRALAVRPRRHAAGRRADRARSLATAASAPRAARRLAALIPTDPVVTGLADASTVLLAKTDAHKLSSRVTTIDPFSSATRDPRRPAPASPAAPAAAGGRGCRDLALAATGSDTRGSVRSPGHIRLHQPQATFGLVGTRGLLAPVRPSITPASPAQSRTPWMLTAMAARSAGCRPLVDAAARRRRAAELRPPHRRGADVFEDAEPVSRGDDRTLTRSS